MLLVPQAGTWHWRNALYSHQSHEPLYSLPVGWIAFIIQLGCYLTTAVKRCTCILLINQVHQVQIFRVFLSRRGLVIPTRPVQSDQLTLSLNAHLWMIRLYAPPLIVNGHCLIFFSTSPELHFEPTDFLIQWRCERIWIDLRLGSSKDLWNPLK